MTVQELIIRLAACDNQDALVVLSRDEEGNGFHALTQINSGNSVFTSEQEVGLRGPNDTLRAEGYTEEDIQEGEDCVVLWP